VNPGPIPRALSEAAAAERPVAEGWARRADAFGGDVSSSAADLDGRAMEVNLDSSREPARDNTVTSRSGVRLRSKRGTRGIAISDHSYSETEAASSPC
jgi:hypothetical protein